MGTDTPHLLAWLIAFVLIGLYQRPKTQWPQPPSGGPLTPAGVQTYRAALERRRDEQYKWPARRRPLAIGIVAFAFLVGVARLFAAPPGAGPVSMIDAFAGPSGIAVLVLGMYVVTRTFTDRAAAAFQREIDTLDSSGRGPGQE